MNVLEETPPNSNVNGDTEEMRLDLALDEEEIQGMNNMDDNFSLTQPSASHFLPEKSKDAYELEW